MSNILKEQELFRLLENYTDVFGAVTLYNKSQSNPLIGQWDSENQHLFTGEIALLLKLNNLEDSIYYEKFIANCRRHIASCRIDMDGKTIPGLYSRHPMYLYRNHPDYHSLSHDEKSGLLYQSIALNEISIAKEMLQYGKEYNYTYIEEQPFANPVKELGSNLYQGLNKIASLFKSKDAREEAKKDVLTQQLSRILQPKDRAFLKLVAGEDPRYSEYFQLMLNIVLSATTSKEETTGKLLSFFKCKSLDMIDHKGLLFTLSKKFLHYRLRKTYGDNYMREVVSIFFRDINHPIHGLINGITLE